MRLFISLSAATILAVFALAACNSTERNRNTANTGTLTPLNANAQPSPQGDNVRRITVSELRDAMDRGDVFIVDVRSESSYNTGHIKGAHLIPSMQIIERVSELPRDKMIVTYCS